MKIKYNKYFIILFFLILYSCDYDQSKFDVNVSVDKSIYNLLLSNGQYSQELINIEISGGMSKGIIYPVIAKYGNNGQLISATNLVNNLYLNDCCYDDHPDVDMYTPLICLCDIDELSSSITINDNYVDFFSFDQNHQYKVLIIDPYVKNGKRQESPLSGSFSLSEVNIISESNYFSFGDEFNVTPCLFLDASSLNQLSANVLYNSSPSGASQFSISNYGFDNGPCFYGSATGGYVTINVNVPQNARMRFWYKRSNPGFWTFNPPDAIINGGGPYSFSTVVPISTNNNGFLQAQSDFYLQPGNHSIKLDLGGPGGTIVGFFIDDIEFICF